MLDTLSYAITVLLFVLAGLFVWLAFSPFETLGWWAGWFGDSIYWETPPEYEETQPGETLCYIIFFSGVGRATGETRSYRERDFLERLTNTIPEAVIIDDIFPYAVNNLALTEQPWFKRFWRISLRAKAGGIPLAGYFINLRNIAQILVSADRRYGPIFNQGVAEVIANGLLRHGYSLESLSPIFIIGYSGAGQTALGASLYVKHWLHAPTYIISLGGVFSSDPALLEIDQLYHLVGSRDAVEKAGLVAPGRWPIMATSEWNRAIKQGKVTRIEMGPMGHTGSGGYLDAKSHLANGEEFIAHTVSIVRQIVSTELAANRLTPPVDQLIELGAPAEPVTT